MIKTNILLLFCLMLSPVFAQETDTPIYAIRKYKTEETFRSVSADCYFLKGTGVKPGSTGWIYKMDMMNKDSNLFYFNLYGLGNMMLAVEMEPGTTMLNFDSLNPRQYYLVNDFGGNNREEEITRNTISGKLSFAYRDGKVTIDGSVKIESQKPLTQQEIVFRKYETEILTLQEKLEREEKESEMETRLRDARSKIYHQINREKYAYYDSAYKQATIPDHNLMGTLGNRAPFHFTRPRSESGMLTSALLIPDQTTRKELEEFWYIGKQGHEWYGQKKHVLALEGIYFKKMRKASRGVTFFYLSIAVDSLQPGKQYEMDKGSSGISAKLEIEYDEGGCLVGLVRLEESRSAKGSMTITRYGMNTISGYLDLEFKNSDGSKFAIKGPFEVPAIRFSEIVTYERSSSEKYSRLTKEIEKK